MTESICLCRGAKHDPTKTGVWHWQGFCPKCGDSMFGAPAKKRKDRK